MARDYVQDSRDRWAFRRMVIFAVLGVLGVLLLALARTGNEEMYGQTLWAIVTLVALYIGAPVADDFLQTRVPGRRA
jgi:VanZ family protein